MDHQGCLTIIVVSLIVGIAIIGGCFGFANKHIFGNKQWIDFKQTFNVAYLEDESGKLRKIPIQAWKDYENSDSVQIIDMNGKPYYTHLSRVILTKE